jgi:hypothetical protein
MLCGRTTIETTVLVDCAGGANTSTPDTGVSVDVCVGKAVEVGVGLGVGLGAAGGSGSPAQAAAIKAIAKINMAANRLFLLILSLSPCPEDRVLGKDNQNSEGKGNAQEGVEAQLFNYCNCFL